MAGVQVSLDLRTRGQRADLDDEAEALSGAASAVGLPHDVVGAPDVVGQQGVHPAGQVWRDVRVWEGRRGTRTHQRRIQKPATGVTDESCTDNLADMVSIQESM